MNITIQLYTLILLLIVFYQSTLVINLCNYVSPILLLFGLIGLILFNNNYTLTLLIIILYFVCIVKKNSITTHANFNSEESNSEESNSEESNNEESNSEESNSEESNSEESNTEESNNEESNNEESNNEESNNESEDVEVIQDTYVKKENKFENNKEMYLLLNSQNIDYNTHELLANNPTQLDRLENNNDTFCK